MQGQSFVVEMELDFQTTILYNGFDEAYYLDILLTSSPSSFCCTSVSW